MEIVRMGFLDNPAFALNICPESERQPMKFPFDPKPDCDARMLRPDLCPSGGFSLKFPFAPRFFGDPDDRRIKTIVVLKRKMLLS